MGIPMYTAATPQYLVKVSDKNHYKQLIKKAHTENVVKSAPYNNLRLHLVREKCHCERFRYCNWSADNERKPKRIIKFLCMF